MARPNKQGLDYFPFDIDFFSDEKIEAISGEFGIKGEITAIKLLCVIYRNGYFISWNDMLKMKLLKNLPGVSSELLDNIVNRLVKWDFFDKNLFDSMKILTSRGIQNRFFSISKRRKKSEEYPYLVVNVCNNYPETELLYTKSTQRKEKERKINESNIPPISPKVGNLGFDEKYKDPLLKIETLRKTILECETIWWENVAMQLNVKTEIEKWLNKFFDWLVMTGEETKSLKDFKAHFVRWLKIELGKTFAPKQKFKSETNVNDIWKSQK